jgi:hypothetical protein
VRLVTLWRFPVIHRRSGALRVGLGVLVALTSAIGSTADVLHLKTGGRLEGVLIQKTPATVTIDMGMGQVSVPRSAVVRIETGSPRSIRATFAPG